MSKLDEQFYLTWSNDLEKAEVVKKFSEAIDNSVINNNGVHSVYAASNPYQNIDTNLSVRNSYTRQDYERFRPEEALPTKPKEIISSCNLAYKRVSVVRNVVDLMADFASQGIELIHPNTNIQKFYQNWFKKVNGKERSERFLNLLYRKANVICRRQTAKLTIKDKKNVQQGFADADIKVQPLTTNKREIPWKYIFLNIDNLEVEGGELAAFTGDYNYYISLPNKFKNNLNDNILNKLPKEISEAIKTKNAIPLDKEKVVAYFYKKDDWEIWAEPFIYSLLDDLILLEKMRLADLSALDGVISNIRIWKLGNLDKQLLPTTAAISKLANILSNVSAGGTADLIWGPDLQFEQHIPDVNKVLGSEKYVSVMQRIFTGLGIPPTLTGLSSGSGFSNNYISLKTLLERLQYGREILMSFWEHEIKLVQKAMGFKKPAKVRFSRMTLADEAAEKTLLIQLAERNLITWETVLERFGEDPELEKMRYKKELRAREKGNIPPQAGPWHDPYLIDKNMQRLKELALQSGLATLSQVGLDLPPPKDGENTVYDLRDRPDFEEIGGKPGQGRPKNVKDSEKRKRKEVVIRTSASAINLALWAKHALEKIDYYVNPTYLEGVNKNNLRQLSNEEAKELNNIKFLILSNIKPYETLNEQSVLNILNNNPIYPDNFFSLYKNLIINYQSIGSDPSLEDLRNLQTMLYGVYNT